MEPTPDPGFIIQLHHFAVATLGLVATMLSIYRFGIAPRLKSTEEKAVSTATYRAEINHKIERLEEQFEAHLTGENNQLSTLTTTFQESIREAREDRRGMYTMMGEIKTEMGTVNAELKGLEGQIKGYFSREAERAG